VLAVLVDSPSIMDFLPKKKAVTKESTAVDIARKEVIGVGQLWCEPVLVVYCRGPDGPYWFIRTHWPGSGYCNIVTIDDHTAKVIGSHTLLR
jgi:hypothetical protein